MRKKSYRARVMILLMVVSALLRRLCCATASRVHEQ